MPLLRKCTKLIQQCANITVSFKAAKFSLCFNVNNIKNLFKKIIMKKITYLLSAVFVCSFILFAAYSCSDTKEGSTTDESSILSETRNNINPDIKIAKFDEVITDYYDNGNVFTVEYFEKDGSFESPVFKRKYFRGGNLFMEGGLKDGKREGRWIAWYENGNIWSTAGYSQGVKDGESRVYYETGQLRYIQQYEMNTPKGLWKFYCPEGNLLGEIMYENGTIAWEKNYMEEK